MSSRKLTPIEVLALHMERKHVKRQERKAAREQEERDAETARLAWRDQRRRAFEADQQRKRQEAREAAAQARRAMVQQEAQGSNTPYTDLFDKYTPCLRKPIPIVQPSMPSSEPSPVKSIPVAPIFTHTLFSPDSGIETPEPNAPPPRAKTNLPTEPKCIPCEPQPGIKLVDPRPPPYKIKKIKPKPSVGALRKRRARANKKKRLAAQKALDIVSNPPSSPSMTSHANFSHPCCSTMDEFEPRDEDILDLNTEETFDEESD